MKLTLSILLTLTLSSDAAVYRVYIKDYEQRFPPAMTLRKFEGEDKVIHCDTWAGLAQVYAWYFRNHVWTYFSTPKL